MIFFATAAPIVAQPVPDADTESATDAGTESATDAGSDASAEADAYGIDFRNQRFDPDTLMPIGHDSLYGLRLLKPEPRGLRIIIPSHQGAIKPNIGVAPAFEIVGDFEITAAYDLVTAEKPHCGAGAGANLYLRASGTGQGVSLRRGVNPEGDEVYFLHWSVLSDDGAVRNHWKYIPASSRRGELGLKRRGSTLHYLAADETGELKEIHQVDFGTASIGLLRLEAQTDRSASTVDVVWNNFSVRADKLRPVTIPLYDEATKATDEGAEGDATGSESGEN